MSMLLIVLGAMTLIAIMGVAGGFLGFCIAWCVDRGVKYVRRYIREHRKITMTCAYCGGLV